MINITDVRVYFPREPQENSKTVAVVAFTIDGCFAIHGVKVIKGDQDYFVRMPSTYHQRKESRDVCHPLNTETREYVHKTILDAFRKELENR